jgi:hypothetical protein
MPEEPRSPGIGALFTLAEFGGGVLFGTSFDAKNFDPIVKDVQIRSVSAPLAG